MNRLSFAEQTFDLFQGWALAWLAREAEVGRRASVSAALAASERGRAQGLLDLMRGPAPAVEPGIDLTTEGARLLGPALREGSAVLAYLVTSDTLLVWFAPPGGPVDVARHTVSRDSVSRLVQALRAGLGADEATAQARVAQRGGPPMEAPAASPFRSAAVGAEQGRPALFAAAARTLAALILPTGLEHRLASTAELIIVPQGPLALVPFAALPADSADRPLGIRYALRYAPSLATLEETERRQGLPADAAAREAALRAALVVGNPAMPTVTAFNGMRSTLAPLPGAETEARVVAARLRATPLVGAGAKEVEVRRRLAGAAVVHLSTHGWAYAAPARARDSFVALAAGGGEDGLLTVGELVDDRSLRLTADLVVLSACQTGLGDLKQAEGTVGLQRAFLAKGARSLLVSLWSVSDDATGALMTRFYGHWLATATGQARRRRCGGRRVTCGSWRALRSRAFGPRFNWSGRGDPRRGVVAAEWFTKAAVAASFQTSWSWPRV